MIFVHIQGVSEERRVFSKLHSEVNMMKVSAFPSAIVSQEDADRLKSDFTNLSQRVFFFLQSVQRATHTHCPQSPE